MDVLPCDVNSSFATCQALRERITSYASLLDNAQEMGNFVEVTRLSTAIRNTSLELNQRRCGHAVCTRCCPLTHPHPNIWMELSSGKVDRSGLTDMGGPQNRG